MKLLQTTCLRSKRILIFLVAICVSFAVWGLLPSFRAETVQPLNHIAYADDAAAQQPNDMDKVKADLIYLDCTVRGAVQNMGAISTRLDLVSKAIPDPQKFVQKSDIEATAKLAGETNDKVTALTAKVDELSKEVDSLKEKIAELEPKKKEK
jgi:hypothetical protein